MPADFEISFHRNNTAFLGLKTLAPENQNIEFEPVLIEECKEVPIKEVEKLKETIERSSGRPKNARLSALASKRNLARAKRNAQPPTPAQTSADEPEKAKIMEISDVSDAKETVYEEKHAKKKYDLSSMDRLALSQNLSHMASQVRQDMISTPDVIALTHGLRCEEKPLNRCFREPSRGMSLLFPGKDKKSRGAHVNFLHHGLHSLIVQYVDEGILKPADLLEKVTPFDFSTCPLEAVAAADRLEVEAARRRRKQPKRLVAFDKALKPQKKNPNLDLDALSAKRLLKNRLKDDADRSLRVVICGSASAGKSTLLASLLRFSDPASFPEKVVSKVKWEAEKAGRPGDYLTWLVDELPAERRCGHSWDLTDASVTLPSGRSCHLFDCPGSQVALMSDLTAYAHAFVMVVDVTRAAAGDSDLKQHVSECLKIIKEQSSWSYAQVIVVLNKMDRCDCSTRQANEAKRFLNNTFSDIMGNGTEKSVVFIPACAVTGDGLIPSGKEPRSENGRVSFNTCLIDVLENVKPIDSLSDEPSPVDLKPPVLRVRDVYENMGAGFTAVADVVQGLVAAGQALICFPSGATLTVRSVQLCRAGRLVSVKCATVGELVHLVLWQVEIAAVKRGSIICHPLLSPERSPDFKDDCVHVQQRFQARIEVIDLHGCSLFNGRQVIFHSFAMSLPAFVSRLLWVTSGSGPDAQTSDVKLKPMAVSRTGAIVGVELILELPHVCIPSLDIGLKFSLMVNNSLMATGVISKLLEDGLAVDALRVHDCNDTRRLVFYRSGDCEQMEVD